MNGLLETTRELQVFCDHNGWLFCFIGGIAVQRWGEPRVTRAIDLSLLTGFGAEERYIDILLYIETQLRPLAEVKGDPEILRTLARLRQL
jgi:hypothetical protein